MNDIFTKKPNLRAVPCSGSVLVLIEDGYSELSELQQECQAIIDNAPDGLSETERMQTLGDTADALSEADLPPDVPDFLMDLKCRYTEDQRISKSTSRATRCAEAVTLLSAACDAIQKWIDVNDLDEYNDSGEYAEQRDEAEGLLNQVQNFIGNAEGCEFPGMFG